MNDKNNKPVVGQIRQGDILLVPVDVQPPPDAKTVTRVVMAEGEITGHSHDLVADEIKVWDDMVFVVGPEPGGITHQDHDPDMVWVVAPEQTYKIVHQREQTLDGAWVQVVD